MTVQLREDAVLPSLDHWLAHAFAPEHLARSLTALHDTQPTHHAHTEAARHDIAACDRKLTQYRAALEAGADPALIATWTRDIQARRATAQATLNRLTSTETPPRGLSRTEIKNVIDALDGLLAILGRADPADKADVYRQLGLRLTYDHQTQTVLAESRPAPDGVLIVSEGGLEPPRPIKGTSTSS